MWSRSTPIAPTGHTCLRSRLEQGALESGERGARFRPWPRCKTALQHRGLRDDDDFRFPRLRALDSLRLGRRPVRLGAVLVLRAGLSFNARQPPRGFAATRRLIRIAAPLAALSGLAWLAGIVVNMTEQSRRRPTGAVSGILKPCDCSFSRRILAWSQSFGWGCLRAPLAWLRCPSGGAAPSPHSPSWAAASSSARPGSVMPPKAAAASLEPR